MTNYQFSTASHCFYNPRTNEMVLTHYRRDLEMYEVIRGNYERTITFVMSMDRILEERGNEVWEFLGVL